MPEPRRYVRLGADDVVIAAYLRHDRNARAVAREFGCSISAVTTRLEAIALRTGVDHRRDVAGERLRARAEREAAKEAARAARQARLAALRAIRADPAVVLDRLTELEATVEELVGRVASLEARPMSTRIVEFKPNHRRKADGGLNVNEQKRQLRREIGA